MLTIIGVVMFFLLFLGAMIAGNYLSHYFERSLNKQADRKLESIEIEMNNQVIKD